MAEKLVKTLSTEQRNLVDEFYRHYKIKAENIFFYDETPEPFFSYEATCKLCNILLNLSDIDIDSQITNSPETISMKCRIASDIGRRSAVGYANLNETIQGGKITEVAAVGLASARAVRNTLKAAGINLLEAHRKAIATGEVTEISDKDNLRNSLLAEAHVLGKEAGLLNGSNKTLWHHFLANRFDGIESSKDLTNEQITELNAALRAYASATAKTAA